MVKDITIDNGLKALLDSGGKIGSKGSGDQVSFSEMLKNTISEVNELQKEAEVATGELLKGNASIHDTMIAIEKADLSFRYMMKARTNIMEAYKEVMRMQV